MNAGRVDEGPSTWAVLLFFGAFFLGQLDGCAGCALVSAQDTRLPPVSGRCAPEIGEPRRALLEHAGTTGLWFHLDVARCMGARLVALPLYAERVRLLEQRLELSDERDALQVRRVRLAGEEAQAASEALEAAVRSRRRAEEALDAWWRHPALWFIVGAVVVVGLEVLAVWAFSEVIP